MDVTLSNVYNNQTGFNEIFARNRQCFLQENGVHIMQTIKKGYVTLSMISYDWNLFQEQETEAFKIFPAKEKEL
jgi:hypothetical protein